MSGLSVITSRLHRISVLLEPYLLALGPIRTRGGRIGRPDEVKSLLGVLAPIDRYLRDVDFYDLSINVEKTVGFLRTKHREDWPRIKAGILSITERLRDGDGTRTVLSDKDLEILYGVASALNHECSSLFNEARQC